MGRAIGVWDSSVVPFTNPQAKYSFLVFFSIIHTQALVAPHPHKLNHAAMYYMSKNGLIILFVMVMPVFTYRLKFGRRLAKRPSIGSFEPKIARLPIFWWKEICVPWDE